MEFSGVNKSNNINNTMSNFNFYSILKDEDASSKQKDKLPHFPTRISQDTYIDISNRHSQP